MKSTFSIITLWSEYIVFISPLSFLSILNVASSSFWSIYILFMVVKHFLLVITKSITDLSFPCSLVHNPSHISSFSFTNFISNLSIIFINCLPPFVTVGMSPFILSPISVLKSPIIIDCWFSYFAFIISSVIDVYNFLSSFFGVTPSCGAYIAPIFISFFFYCLVVSIMPAIHHGYCFQCVFDCYQYLSTIWCLIISIYGLIYMVSFSSCIWASTRHSKFVWQSSTSSCTESTFDFNPLIFW